MSKVKWPDEVPVLEAKDICRHRMTDYAGKRCLTRWVCDVFPVALPDVSVRNKVFNKIEAVIGSDQIVGFNDDKRNSLKAIAKAWNVAMAALGYVVNNPEAKAVRK